MVGLLSTLSAVLHRGNETFSAGIPMTEFKLDRTGMIDIQRREIGLSAISSAPILLGPKPLATVTKEFICLGRLPGILLAETARKSAISSAAMSFSGL
jgi:hypothetical protein